MIVITGRGRTGSLFAADGRMISLKISLTASAIGVSSPAGPTRFGPGGSASADDPRSHSVRVGDAAHQRQHQHDDLDQRSRWAASTSRSELPYHGVASMSTTRVGAAPDPAIEEPSCAGRPALSMPDLAEHRDHAAADAQQAAHAPGPARLAAGRGPPVTRPGTPPSAPAQPERRPQARRNADLRNARASAVACSAGARRTVRRSGVDRHVGDPLRGPVAPARSVATGAGRLSARRPVRRPSARPRGHRAVSKSKPSRSSRVAEHAQHLPGRTRLAERRTTPWNDLDRLRR